MYPQCVLLADISLAANEHRNELIRQASHYLLRLRQWLRFPKVPHCDVYGTAGCIADALGADAHPKDSTFLYNKIKATLPSSTPRPTRLFESNPHIVLIEGGVVGGLPRFTATTDGTFTENPDVMSPD